MTSEEMEATVRALSARMAEVDDELATLKRKVAALEKKPAEVTPAARAAAAALRGRKA